MGRIFVRKIGIEHVDPLHVLGQNDQNLRFIERHMPVRITMRDSTLSVAGDEAPVEDATRVLKEIVGLHHPVGPATLKTITSLPRLLEDLAATRQRGFAIDDEENEARVRCVAAPVFAASGEVVSAIGVSGTIGQISDEQLPKIGAIVRSAAMKLSAQLGGLQSRKSGI